MTASAAQLRDPAMDTLRLSQEARQIAELIDAASCALLAASEQQLDDDSAGSAERLLAVSCLNGARVMIDTLMRKVERRA